MNGYSIRNHTLRSVLITLGMALSMTGCASQSANQPVSPAAGANKDIHSNASTTASLKEGQAKLGVPGVLAEEHRALHKELEAAIKAGGMTGEAAQAVEERLSEHFKKEEEYALPQLGLLAELAEGKLSPDAEKAIELSDKLKAELPKMLEEHKGIVAALDTLEKAATQEKSDVGLQFVKTLRHHAVNEEQVMYPAAILVGEYLKLKTK